MKNIMLVFLSKVGLVDKYTKEQVKEKIKNEIKARKEENSLDNESIENLIEEIIDKNLANKKKKIRESTYNFIIDGKEEKRITLQTTESAVIELYSKVGKIDKIFAFCTETVLNDENPYEPYNNEDTSSLEIFKDRIKEYATEVIICPYKEKQRAEESLATVSEFARKVLDDTKVYREQGEEIYLHADMTGGIRSASMMMIGIMRFLEYSNYKLGNILYSNWDEHRVENAENVYRFFDLVAGAKEFVHYGSVKEIDSYFSGRDIKDKSENYVDDLKKAMDKFSENIKLCQYSSFKKSIVDLKKAIDNFDTYFSSKDNNSKDSNIKDNDSKLTDDDKLFNIMLPTIKEEYKGLWELSNDKIKNDDIKPVAMSFYDKLFYKKVEIEKLNEFEEYDRTEEFKTNLQNLSIIKWCIDKGYLQQALTLYVELLPDMIVEQFIFTTEENKRYNEKDKSRKEHIKDLTKYGTWHKFLITYYDELYFLKERKSEKFNSMKENEKRKIIVREMIENNQLKVLFIPEDKALEQIDFYNKVKGLRNETNHANSKSKNSDIKENITKSITNLAKAIMAKEVTLRNIK